MVRCFLTLRQVITLLAGIYMVLATYQWITFQRNPIMIFDETSVDVDITKFEAAEAGNGVQMQTQPEIGHDIIKTEPAGLNPVGTSFKTNGTRYGKPSFPPGYEKSGLAQEQHVEGEMSVPQAFFAAILGILLSVLLVVVLFICLEETFQRQKHLLILPEPVVPCCRNI
ncbi:unnamed protein product [Orchesella dallaii]